MSPRRSISAAGGGQPPRLEGKPGQLTTPSSRTPTQPNPPEVNWTSNISGLGHQRELLRDNLLEAYRARRLPAKAEGLIADRDPPLPAAVGPGDLRELVGQVEESAMVHPVAESS